MGLERFKATEVTLKVIQGHW